MPDLRKGSFVDKKVEASEIFQEFQLRLTFTHEVFPFTVDLTSFRDGIETNSFESDSKMTCLRSRVLAIWIPVLNAHASASSIELAYPKCIERPYSYADAVAMDHNVVGGNPTGSTAGLATPASQIQANQSPAHRVDELDDPLYLHATENPNTILVSPPLSESNYATWSRSIKIALGVKNKFGSVTGAIPCPTQSDVRYGTWKRCNDIVSAWTLRSLNPSIAESVLYFEIAEDIWNTLKKRYSQAELHKITEIQNKSIEVCKAVRPLPICECTPRCNCTLMSKVKKDREDDQVIRFLEGLSDEYETIKSGALVMDPLPNMEKVLNVALKLERKLNSASSYKNSKVVQSNAVQNQGGDDQNIVAVTSSNNKKKFNGYEGKNVADVGLSADQFQKLVSVLQGQNQGSQGGQASTNAAITMSKIGMRPKFIPTGATDHITCSLDYIENYHKIHGIFVKLPNGESVQLTKQNDCTLVMNADLCDILGLHGIMDGFAKAKYGLYLLNHPPAKIRQCVDSVDAHKHCNSLSLQLWHNRLGHYPADKKRPVFPVSTTRTEKSFDLMHLDVWEPFAVSSLKREHYFLTIVDDYSRFTWIHLMKNKSEVKGLFQNFYQYVDTQFSAKIKAVR
ncbi:PREDICTED: uncharacterized protein LOC109156600 [Ipomoea nil]|uniref:uncharacterized protein LOC109156600 n=1 Tax=Ipomoea nil TaxID=35883 RepID=UPI00090158A8|nr:PREDICTED: uncharacterized protein LOC109156600 [Ipomoea nil]